MASESGESNRIKAMTLFFALERGLARLLRAIATCPSQIPEATRTRLQGLAREDGLNPDLATNLIAQMYFQELLEVLAAQVTATDTVRHAAAELLSYVEKVGLHEVRIACAHQNRAWKPNYLAIVEAVCLSEPVTVGLELVEVGEAYGCIQRNMLEVPPDDWLGKIRPPGLPNNLAAHSRAMRNATYVGRREERGKLRRHLMAARTNSVCVVGPGGIGKTAFALKVLSDLSEDSAARSRFDRILFVTGKQRALTSSGVVRRTPDFASLDELRLAIALELETESFDECVDALSDLRLLLCVDNIEDLISAHPDCLEDLQENLPVPWVLLTTSRVAVSAQYSVVLPSLSTGDLKSIAMERLRNAGIEPSTLSDLARVLAENAPSPLALTVAADLVCFGGANAAQALVRSAELSADFAFSSLLDLQTPLSLGVLDAIHATTERADLDTLAALLHAPRSDIDVSVHELRRANLLVQAGPGSDDQLAFVPAVRDLLSRRAVSEYGRDQLYKEWRLIQREAQVLGNTVDHGMPELESRPLAKRQLIKIRERIRRSDSIGDKEYSDVSSALRAFEAQFGPTLNSCWLSADLAERRPPTRHEVPSILERALQLDQTSWLVRARLAKLRFDEKDYSRCAELLKPIVLEASSSTTPIPERSFIELFTRYFQSRTYFESDRMVYGLQRDTGGLHKILDELQNIDISAVELNRRLAMATLLRRIVERAKSAKERFDGLNQALAIINDTFEERGSAVHWWCSEITELLAQFVYCSRGSDAFNIRREALLPALRFAEKWGPSLVHLHLEKREIQAVLRDLNLASPEATEEARGHNDSHLEREANVKPNRGGEFSELARLGFVYCTVYAAPNGRPYCFARDEHECQYYVHRNILDCSDTEFDAVSRGAPIAVLPEGSAAGGRAVPALSATLL
jgi:hypothetical protein